MKAQLIWTDREVDEISGEKWRELYEQGFRGTAWLETEKCKPLNCVFRRGFVRMHNRKTKERVFLKYVQTIYGQNAFYSGTAPRRAKH